MDRAAAQDLRAQAAALRSYSAELRAYCDEVLKQARSIRENARVRLEARTAAGFSTAGLATRSRHPAGLRPPQASQS
jgi:hypothetical protein